MDFEITHDNVCLLATGQLAGREGEFGIQKRSPKVYSAGNYIIKFIDENESPNELLITQDLSQRVQGGETDAFPMLYGYGYCGDDLYVVLDNMGTSLTSYLLSGELPLSLYEIVDRVGEILNYLDRVGIVHNDLHVGNVIIDDSDPEEVSVHLIDFGFSDYIESEYNPSNDISELLESISENATAAVVRAYPNFAWSRSGFTSNRALTADLMRFIDNTPNATGVWDRETLLSSPLFSGSHEEIRMYLDSEASS